MLQVHFKMVKTHSSTGVLFIRVGCDVMRRKKGWTCIVCTRTCWPSRAADRDAKKGKSVGTQLTAGMQLINQATLLTQAVTCFLMRLYFIINLLKIEQEQNSDNCRIKKVPVWISLLDISASVKYSPCTCVGFL